MISDNSLRKRIGRKVSEMLHLRYSIYELLYRVKEERMSTFET